MVKNWHGKDRYKVSNGFAMKLLAALIFLWFVSFHQGKEMNWV